MAELFADGSIVTWILGLLVVEAFLLGMLRARTRLSWLDLLASLGAGAALLLALRSALRAEPWQVIALWLIASFAAHLLDLKQRLIFSRTQHKG